MVAPEKKRKLTASTGPAPKRSKNSKPQPRQARKSRRALDAESLAWKTVGEEFGGLQVIEGVDVVRDGDRVQFLVASDDDNNKQAVEETEDADQGDTFEGFGDDPVEGGAVDPGQAGGAQICVAGKDGRGKDEEQAAGKKDKNKNKNKKLGSQQDKQLAKAQEDVQKSAPRGGNVFGALADAQEDEDVDVAAWVPLNLSPGMLSAVAKLNFEKPTTIQKRAIPEILAGEDVIGKAQTGSGKTLAFGIPIVEKWLEMYDGREEAKKSGPMAVVLSPTRELAKQLGDHLKALCNGLPSGPYVVVVTGGLSIHKQQRQLEKADIVIGTPGRLWEVLDGDIKLQDKFSKIRFLVVDEADRLFKAGQFKEAEDIIGALDKKNPEADTDEDSDDEEDVVATRQTLVFSATFDKDLQTKLAGKVKNSSGNDDEKMAYLMKCLKFRGEPKFIDVNPAKQMASGLREGLIECGAMEKVSPLPLAIVIDAN